jgi:type I restriction enzyme, R subunit
MPPLIKEGLRPAQVAAIENLEVSLANQRPRALIQMVSGGGKGSHLAEIAVARWRPPL